MSNDHWQQDILDGETVGGYCIEGMLGKGGMGGSLPRPRLKAAAGRCDQDSSLGVCEGSGTVVAFPSRGQTAGLFESSQYRVNLWFRRLVQ